MTYSKFLKARIGIFALRSSARSTTRAVRALLPLLLFAACGFPRPADVGDDAGPGDSSEPGVTVHVSPSGDDANDGLTQPVKTLKRAIAIAGSNMTITTIALDAGSYTTAAGEVFPYTVPANVTISGPATGGAILVGSDVEDGLAIDTGRLQDLELDNFKVAIIATRQIELARVHVKNSMLAVRGDDSAKLNITGLEIVGSVSTCGAGIQLNGTATLAATAIDTHNLTYAVKAMDPNIITIEQSSIVGDPRCDCTALQISTGQTFTLTGSTVVGCAVGLQLSGLGFLQTNVTIVDTILRNSENSISAVAGTVLRMTGGELSNDTKAAAAFFGGFGSFINVKMDNNLNAVSILGGPTVGVATILMRGCMVTNNKLGVLLFDMSAGELGTDADPGNNIFQNNQMVGVSVQGAMGPKQVDAVGNIWNSNTQGANENGIYQNVSTVLGPVTSVAGNNFDIASGLSLRR